ncbi:MAG: choice-of-anchor J domain-containing protein [Flavobacteriaceae bacterium]|jgi:gliding motility-associated-like protein|nr:choice-of-anchor J domain-containing protein [Flavobacteriaceae bacterium]
MHHLRLKTLLALVILFSFIGIAKIRYLHLIDFQNVDEVLLSDKPQYSEYKQSDKIVFNQINNTTNTTCQTNPLPFWEGFNSSSTTIGCWKIQNKTTATTVKWSTHVYDPFGLWEMILSNGSYEGDQAMSYINADGVSENDAYLISPDVHLQANKLYKLRYDYRIISPFEDPTSINNNNAFEVLMSSSGTSNLSFFNQSVVSNRTYTNDLFATETAFIQGNNQVVNLAWHITTKGKVGVFIDNVFIEEVVDCAEPIAPMVSNVTSNQVTISWSDMYNTSWEYLIQDYNGPIPTTTTSGTSTSSKLNVVATDKGGKSLVANKDYEFYLRAKCNTTKSSQWIGPILFRTSCNAMGLPFAEDFNTTSPTFKCWSIIDANNDGLKLPVWMGNMNMWTAYEGTYDPRQGDQVMRFAKLPDSGTNADDWLISPTFNLDAQKMYSIKYYYKNSDYAKMEVLASNQGIATTAFTTTVSADKKYSNSLYQEENLFLTGLGGNVNIAFHVTEGTDIFIDSFDIKEVSCVEPNFLSIVNKKSTEITIKWEDAFNKEWEYFVQPIGNGSSIGNGTKVTSSQTKITKDNQGNNLLPGTNYEFYVRSICSPTEASNWIGPLPFTTACTTFPLPFNETFDKNSPSLMCWNTIDVGKDENANGINGYSYNIWQTYSSSNDGGNQSMYFLGEIYRKHDDWLISPMVRFNGGIYAITYSFMTDKITGPEEFEILLSKDGIGVDSFTTIVQPSNTHDTFGKYEKKTVYVKGISGDINVAWRITSKKNSNSQFYLKDVTIEEIECIAPSPEISLDNVYSDKVSFSWEDDNNTTWEYYVSSNGSAPVGSGRMTQQKSVTTTTDNRGNPLVPNTYYQIYIRSNCDKGKYSKWIGPINFMTQCTALTLPFWEGFNQNSTTYACWRIDDIKKDGYTWFAPPRTVNTWGTYIYDRYEGDRVATFFGEDRKHDDWFVTPLLKFEGKDYVVSYYYKTGTSRGISGSTTQTEVGTNRQEVLLSTQGIGKKAFTTVLEPFTTYVSKDYVQKTFFIRGLKADVNLAWHVEMQGESIFLMDNLEIKEVDCIPPTPTISLKDATASAVKLEWTGNTGTWEYYIQPTGMTVPTKSGVKATTSNITINTLTNGKNLDPNSSYDVYVRSQCANGQYSIWLGPYTFKTTCNTVAIPFWEGFNTLASKKKSDTIGCWTILDENKDGVSWRPFAYNVYEGDQDMNFVSYGDNVVNDDWLISPTFNFDGSTYVLKYHYSAAKTDNTEFEVKLSTNGTQVGAFSQTLLSKRSYKNEQYLEEIIYISGVKGDVNIGWHVVNKGGANLYLDNISINKVSGCLEPSAIKQTRQTLNSIDVEWTVNGTENTWDVFVQELGQAKPTASTTPTITVSGTPRATVNNLKAGVPYEIYVRAKCEATSYSDWSSSFTTSIGSNLSSECLNAIHIPVNTGSTCIQTVAASTKGATPSNLPLAPCSIQQGYLADMWFEFTATTINHILSIDGKNIVPGNRIEVTLYDVDCGTININTPANCGTLEGFFFPSALLNNLVVGQKYLVRLGFTSRIHVNDTHFNLCITAPDPTILIDVVDKTYSATEMVNKVLMGATCDVISNVKYQFGTDNKVKALGNFKQNNSKMPFKEGIILTTHDVETANKPRLLMKSDKKKVTKGSGDVQLNNVLKELNNKDINQSKSYSTLEFDYTAVSDVLQYEYMFASDIYDLICDYKCIEGGAAVAILVTDIATGITTNVALVPNTNSAVATSTIRNGDGYAMDRPDCPNINPKYQWKNYSYSLDNPNEAPIDYTGLSVVLKTVPYTTIPGKQYHVKFGVMDLCQHNYHGTALVLNQTTIANLPTLDLGEDKLIEKNQGICANEQYTIESKLSIDLKDKELNAIYTWYKDGKLIDSPLKDQLTVSETGEYMLTVQFTAINCEVSQTVKIEFYEALDKVLSKPTDLSICKQAREKATVDLTAATHSMFNKVAKDRYDVAYFVNKEDKQPIEQPTAFELAKQRTGQTIYVRVKDLQTNCTEWFEFKLVVQNGEAPVKREDVATCDEYILPALANNQFYYTESGGKGRNYKAGDKLSPDVYQLYVLQDNGNSCFEEISYKVEVVKGVDLFVIEDQYIQCDIYALPVLPMYHKYYIEREGQRIEIAPKTPITKSNTRVYIVAETPNKVCRKEGSFEVIYSDCPIPKGFSPNADGVNDSFDLSRHNVSSLKVFNRNGAEVYSFSGNYTNQWDGKSKGGQELPSGTYYYVIQSFDKTKTGWVELQR